MLKGKNILLGVTGGIAAYKAAYLVRLLKKENANVEVIMTKNAQEFVGKLTFEVLSENPVYVDTFQREIPYEVEHVSLAKKADLFIVAPASANFIAKARCGIADDMLTTTFLACKAPKLIAPAMNTGMLENPATVENLEILQRRGMAIIDGEQGFLACKDVGSGRMAEPQDIVEMADFMLGDKDLVGMKILITAGPTEEAIDPVRYLTNRSTGKMGFAVAKVAAQRGADVVLVSGKSQEKDPVGVEVVRVQSAAQMHDMVLSRYEDVDVVIKTAAVCDFTPAKPFTEKIKKQNSLPVEFVRTQDILKELGQKKTHQILVGFAAETQNILEYAKDKLEQKNLDMVVANDVSQEDIGFGSNDNKVSMIRRDGACLNTQKQSKLEIANLILDQIKEMKN
mgnify:CR=1 FL=1